MTLPSTDSFIVRMRKLLHLIFAGTVVGCVAIGGVASPASADAGAAIVARMNDHLPKSWAVVERRPDTLPEGHYWGQNYRGIRGEEILIQGGADVHVMWQDTKGAWHTDAVGKDALKLYVMPSSYRESVLRFLIPKRPVAAPLLFEGQTFKVYANPSFRILERERLDRIVQQSTAIRWPDSPENTGSLSWRSWNDDIPQLLKGM